MKTREKMREERRAVRAKTKTQKRRSLARRVAESKETFLATQAEAGWTARNEVAKELEASKAESDRLSGLLGVLHEENANLKHALLGLLTERAKADRAREAHRRDGLALAS